MNGSIQTAEHNAIAKQDKAKRTIIINVIDLAGYLSGMPPANNIKNAEDNVPIAYIVPQYP